MATRYSPKVTTRGLIFLIDPVNPRCVGAGDTDGLDLVGGHKCTGASGQPDNGAHTPATSAWPSVTKNAYTNNSSNVFAFDGNDGINIDGDLGGSESEISVGGWFYKVNNQTDYFFDFRNDSDPSRGPWFLANYGSSNINFWNQMEYNFGNTAEGSYSADDFPQDVWIHVVVTSGSSDSKIYLNGQQRAAYRTTAISTKKFGINARIGTRYTVGSGWSGGMGPVFLYNRELTAAEVKQNFLAHVGRYEAKLCPESSF